MRRTPSWVNRTLDNVRQLGFDPLDIKYVFVTEAHEIHYGGAAQIKAATGATISLSPADWDFLEHAVERADWVEYDWTTQVAPPRDHEIRDGEVITVGDAQFTLYTTPGHTPGTSSFEYVGYDGDPALSGVDARRHRSQHGFGLDRRVDRGAASASRRWVPGTSCWGTTRTTRPATCSSSWSRGLAGPTGDPHPVVQGAAAIDDWFDTLLEIAWQKAEPRRMAISDGPASSRIRCCRT